MEQLKFPGQIMREVGMQFLTPTGVTQNNNESQSKKKFQNLLRGKRIRRWQALMLMVIK